MSGRQADKSHLNLYRDNLRGAHRRERLAATAQRFLAKKPTCPHWRT